MSRLFVDTSAYYALADTRDENHEAAVHLIHQMIRERAELLTTNYILAETHALLLNRIGYATALQVLEDLYKSQTRIYRVKEAEERKALQILRVYTDKEFSLVDAISFATMERFHVTQAFAFDHHFAQYGFSLQPAKRSRG
jgi:predicted nucleic acid-binding protein